MTPILVLHGAILALTLFALVQFLLVSLRSPLALFGALFAGAVALTSVLQISAVWGGMGPLHAAIFVLHCGKMVYFWWFAQALFDDRFRLRPVHLAPLGLTFAVTFASLTGWVDSMQSLHVHHLITLILVGHVVALALRDLRGDLVDARRSFRAMVGIAIPIFVVGMIGVHTYEAITGLSLNSELAEAAITAGFAFLFTLWLTRIERGLILAAPADTPQPRPMDAPADVLDVARVKALAEGTTLLEPGLTVGKLAEYLKMPEHRLRRLINQGLGYRNFADFLNAHRVAAAEIRLADPDRAREQIISHAFALGYNSLTPFNRAFKARTGQSPTEFRERALKELLGKHPLGTPGL